MVRGRFLLIGTLIFFVLSCTTLGTPVATQTVAAPATTTPPPTATLQPTEVVPVYAAGIQWTDINGDERMFMVEDPASEEYKVDFASWSIDIPNTHQQITVLRHGDPRGYIFVGVWTYISADPENLLIDVAVMGTTDEGVAIEGLQVAVLDQTAANMQLSRLKFPLDFIGTSTEIAPVGFDCEVIPSDPGGNISETDGSSVFYAFMCMPRDVPSA